jgi:hypothetical protein
MSAAMTTATFSSHSLAAYAPRRRPVEREETWFAPNAEPLLDAGDFCAVAFAFAFAAGLVLGGALMCDTYLIAVIARGAVSLNDFAGYHLARDLLPWAATFTVIAAGLAGLGLKLAQGFRARSSGLGFLSGASIR